MASPPISSPVDPQRRRVAFCITDLDPGGAEKALFQIVTHLNQEEWEPRVYCLGPEAELAPRLRECGVTTLCYGGKRWWDIGVLFWLKRELKRFRPDLLQCFLFHGNLVGRLAGRMSRVPVVVAGHRVAEKEKLWHLRLERLTNFLVNHHVCVSQGVADHLMKMTGAAPESVSVIPNGVTPPTFQRNSVNLRQESGWPDDSPVAIAVGRLHPQKGFGDLIQAFSELEDEIPEARLLIVGEGPERPRLEALIRERGLQAKVALAGYRTDVPDLMRQSQVLVISSLWEGMSNVLLEGLAVGVPVVTRPVEGVSELKEQFPDEIFVTFDLKRGLEESLRSKAAFDRGVSGLENLPQAVSQKCLTWQEVARRYAELFSSLANETGPLQKSR